MKRTIKLTHDELLTLLMNLSERYVDMRDWDGRKELQDLVVTIGRQVGSLHDLYLEGVKREHTI